MWKLKRWPVGWQHKPVQMTMIKEHGMNNQLSRRSLLKALGLGLTATALPGLVKAADVTNMPRIVVVGGGFAGATVAKYLKMWGGVGVQVTVIEPNSTYVSPVLSNLVLNGQKTTDDLSFNYINYRQKYGVTMVHDVVTAVDNTSKSVTLASGGSLPYDKLILAPGIDFIYANDDYDTTVVTHAWKSGEQLNVLQAQIDAMQDGDSFVMTVPKAPYRCPPGPYERACVVADYLKNTKGYKACTVTVLDANPEIIVEKETFGNAFTDYGVEYIHSAEVLHVDSVGKTVTYRKGKADYTTESAATLNVIPNQKAGPIVFSAGLNEGNWAPINPLTYESIKLNALNEPQGLDIHIIGDSQATGLPKAGHIGNSEAKICADAILRSLKGLAPDPAPKANSACYSPISTTTASWLTAVYEYNPDTKKMQPIDIVPNGIVDKSASGAPSRENYDAMFNWSGNLFADTFA
jgi:NADH dehydrogenase FAD-containing subunit